MISNLMHKVFGANWKTALSGGLQALISAIVTGSLTLPSDWANPKQDIIFGLVVLGTLCGVKFATVAKDRNITGGTTQQTAEGEIAAPKAQAASASVEDTLNAKPKE